MPHNMDFRTKADSKFQNMTTVQDLIHIKINKMKSSYLNALPDN